MKLEECTKEDILNKRYRCVSIRPPKKGELFARPILGRKSIMSVEIADNDFKINGYYILEKI